MKAHDLANDIMATPFLRGLTDRHIRVLADCACRTHFDQDQIIFHQGETANRFYLIEEGTIQLEAAPKSSERRIVAGRIEPGGVLGWSWLSALSMAIHRARLDPNPRSLFLRNRPARKLRNRPVPRLRIIQTNGRGNGEAAAIGAPAAARSGGGRRVFAHRWGACHDTGA
jgi:hypothetical protein